MVAEAAAAAAATAREFEGACMMTVFCMVGREAEVCCCCCCWGRISTLFCRAVKARAAAVAAALAFAVVETTLGLSDGTAEVIDDVFSAENGSSSTRLPLTMAMVDW